MKENWTLLTETDDWAPFQTQLQELDVYDSKEYVSSAARLESGVACAVYYEQGKTRIFYPFIKRDIEGTDVFDIVTPYGYGGPCLEGDEEVIEPFYARFRDFCNQQRIITETVRLHPLKQNKRYLKRVMELDFIRQTTGVLLTPSIPEIRMGYKKSNLQNIRKAERLGVYCKEGSVEDLSQFVSLYYETMDRNRALPRYYFNHDFFQAQMRDTMLSRTRLLFALYEGEVIAGAMLMIGQQFAHCHLCGSSTKYLPLRPNNLLFDYMIRYAKQEGAKVLHLGGGYRNNDGLLSFKLLFTNNNRYDYHIGKNIFNPDVYCRLNRDAQQRGELDTSYFPLYRSPDPTYRSGLKYDPAIRS